jgi:hypothetical protein
MLYSLFPFFHGKPNTPISPHVERPLSKPVCVLLVRLTSICKESLPGRRGLSRYALQVCCNKNNNKFYSTCKFSRAIKPQESDRRGKFSQDEVITGIRIRTRISYRRNYE